MQQPPVHGMSQKKKKKKKLAALGLSYGMQDLEGGVDSSSPPRIDPWAPALGARSSSHWTTREVPHGMSSYSFDGVFRLRALVLTLRSNLLNISYYTWCFAL